MSDDNPDLRLEMEGAFKMFDKNGNGQIEVNELREVIQCLGENPTVKDVEAMIKEFDINKDGTINFDEFCKMMENRCKSKEQRESELKLAFKMFDKNGDGKISSDELKSVMTNLGEKLTDEEVEDMIKEVDANQDGFVDYNEFVHMYAG